MYTKFNEIKYAVELKFHRRHSFKSLQHSNSFIKLLWYTLIMGNNIIISPLIVRTPIEFAEASRNKNNSFIFAKLRFTYDDLILQIDESNMWNWKTKMNQTKISNGYGEKLSSKQTNNCEMG